MRFDVITIFPDWIQSIGHYGVTGRAVQQGLLEIVSWNLRDFTYDKHRSVDDRPYGGGPGMVMKAEPWSAALAEVKQKAGLSKVILFSPQGVVLTQDKVKSLATEKHLILLAGRYEGIDERFIEQEVDLECSIGDYVLSGGELAAMVLIDAVARMCPGVLGDEASAEQDSFMQGLLDCPHYTRPESWNDQRVPDVLLSGDHGEIARWRRKQSLGRTWLRRPDLMMKLQLNAEDQDLLQEYKDEMTVNSK